MASPFSFGGSQPNPSFSLPQPHLQQPNQTPPQANLLTKDKTPVTYHSKWTDLHPDSQNFLLQIEARILEYRDECRRLDQCERLFDSVALNEGFESDAVRISQDLGGISTAVDRYKVSLQELMKTAKEIMRNAEVSVRSFAMLKSRFPRAAGSSAATAMVPASNGTVQTFGSGTVPAAPTQAMASTLSTEFYSGVPVKPSPFLVHTISRFEHHLQEFRQWVEELERLIFAESDENGKEGHASLLQSLPSVMKNIHDFFIYVAAKVETLHQQMWSIRTTYLADQRRRGYDSNPFLEADRREIAKREAAAKRVHPTLQVAAATQPSALTFGMQTSSTLPSGPSTTPSTLPGSSPFAAFNTSGSMPSASATSFSIPTVSLFGSSSSSATSNLFGSSGATPSLSFGAGTSPSIFGSGSGVTTPSTPGFGAPAASSSVGLFGATPAPSTGLFGSTTPGFGVTPSTGNVFGGPAVGGSAFGIGTGQVTATAKAKGRTTRRK